VNRFCEGSALRESPVGSTFETPTTTFAEVSWVSMKGLVGTSNQEAESSTTGKENSSEAEAVLQELQRILASRHFRSAGRSRQFLQYVVQQKLEGHLDLLKERTIGTEVFQRSPDYATGDDSVVRVQAGEVRRRLDQYYQEVPGDSPVSIKLPVGSYSPTFQWAADNASTGHELLAVTPPVAAQARLHTRRWAIAAACFLVLASVAGIVLFNLQRPTHKRTILEEFWSPVFATQQPVLICLAKAVVYRPSLNLYERYSQAHPGTFKTEVERYNHPLPLDPAEKIAWEDMTVSQELGVSVGDAYAGVSLSSLLGQIGKPSQVRIGSNYSFEDLRNSPAIVVGAFNNRWTMDLTKNLHFAFVEKDGKGDIREQTPGRREWSLNAVNSAGERSDFAIVGRILDSRTGQFIVIVAGVGGTGTQAAAEFVSRREYLEKALRDAPPDWQKKNLEIIVETTITDSIAGPPHAVAAYYW
jgi:hypothetical protein